MLQAAAGGTVDDVEVELPASVLKLHRGCKKDRSNQEDGNAELAYEAGCEKKRRRKLTKHKLSAM